MSRVYIINVKRVADGYVAIVGDGLYTTEPRPTRELARHSARIWVYGKNQKEQK